MGLLEMVARLALALVVGGLVGLERERQDHPAGLRTHMVVCLGSALFTLVSIALAGSRGDPTRVAAQIVTGIGFLGAGTIYRSGSGVRGLTTAAGLWVVSGIGMGIGAGGDMLLLAVIAGVLVFGVNKWVRAWERQVVRSYRELVVALVPGQDALEAVLRDLARAGLVVERAQYLDEAADDFPAVRLRLRLPAGADLAPLTARLAALPGVRHLDWI